VEAAPTELRHVVPPRDSRLVGAIDRGSHDCRRDAVRGEASSSVEERLVVLTDGDAHLLVPLAPQLI
jgi:hypothetical protein